MNDKPTKPFDPALSLQLDKAQIALEEAQTKGDDMREKYAREWKRRLEAVIFQEQEEKSCQL